MIACGQLYGLGVAMMSAAITVTLLNIFDLLRRKP